MLRLLARLAFALICAFCLGCTARPPLTCPERGGPPWSELWSEHFHLETDVDPASARRLLGDMERLYAALAHVLPGPRRESSAKLEVVAFDRPEDMARLVGPGRSAAGFFAGKLDGDFEPHPVLVLSDDARVAQKVVFLHELTHRFLHERFAKIPTWLDEGLAQYTSTLELEGDRVVLGRRRPPAYADFTELPLGEGIAYASATGFHPAAPLGLDAAPSLRRLLDASPREFNEPAARPAFYAAAFRLTHLLATRMPERFAPFLDDLTRGASPDDAFRGRFGRDKGFEARSVRSGTDQRLERGVSGALSGPPIENGSIEAAYVAYLSEDRLETRSVALEPRQQEAPELPRAMRDADVHLLWARLRPWAGRAEATIRADLDEALAREPSFAEAHALYAQLLLSQGRENDAVRELDLAIANRPHDPRLLYARLRARPPRAPVDDRTRALIDRLADVARSATELGFLANAYGVGLERQHLGLVFAERALAADPMCWECEKIRSRIFFGGGRYAEALVAADRALALAPDGAPASGLKSERDFLARLRDADRARVHDREP
jgi:tetratricopeptide (TPR) repeat protein